MNSLLLAVLLAAGPVAAAAPKAKSASDSVESLFQNVRRFLQGPARRARRVTAVAAVRGGIPTEQGENLDLRLTDRVRALRAALLRPDSSDMAARSLASQYDALAASQYVQALSVEGGDAAKHEAAAALAAWARASRLRPLPEAVKALMTGPAAKIDDKALVAAGWGGYVRDMTPADATPKAAAPGWAVVPGTALLDESLESVRESLVQKKLAPADEVKAHVLAGRLLSALAKADLRGREDKGATAASVPALALDDGAAPAALEAPFVPKTIYQKASKSVALILCASEEGSGELGTGSVVDVARRRILTNAHVVIRDATHQPWPVI
ncbi:MAG: hypothetical protein KGL74_05785, partial [Elusimicrobia bacterium]|nr:hypothetical protein [Elusimicrobiota bacterium]